jgi:hypothetical protein
MWDKQLHASVALEKTHRNELLIRQTISQPLSRSNWARTNHGARNYMANRSGHAQRSLDATAAYRDRVPNALISFQADCRD